MLLAVLLALHACLQTAQPLPTLPARPKVAVVTGCNRGVGFATVRGLCRVFDGVIFFTVRNVPRGRIALRQLNRIGCFPTFHHLNIAMSSSRTEFCQYLEKHYGGIDVLVNNAGVRHRVNMSADAFSSTGFNANALRVKDMLHTNFYSTLFFSTAMMHLLRPHGRIVNLSAPCGHVHDLPSPTLRQLFLNGQLSVSDLLGIMDQYKDSVLAGQAVARGWGEDPYCVTKVAVTALTFAQQRRLAYFRPDDDLVVNCYNPGAVVTKVNSYNGSLMADDAATNIIKLALLPHNVTSPVGQFLWHDMSIVDWNGTKPDY